MKQTILTILILSLTIPIYAECNCTPSDTCRYNQARIIDIYDGDSFTAVVNLGYNVTITEKFRVWGVDTPEIRTKDLAEKEEGLEVRNWVRNQLLGKEVQLSAEKKGKFGRWLVTVCYDKKNLREELIKRDYAKPYFGGKRD